MNREDKIFVAGHRGMVGGAVCRALSKAGFGNVVVAINIGKREDFATINNLLSLHEFALVICSKNQINNGRIL